MLKGKKTYLVSALGIAGAIASYFAGSIDMVQMFNTIFGFAGLSTLRVGLKNLENK